MGKKRKGETEKGLYDDVSFNWDVDSKFFEKSDEKSNNDFEFDNKSEKDTKKRKLTKEEKRQKQKEEEEKLREVEQELLAVESNPKTAEHFDRLLLGQPNNSTLWIRYMSFHLQATEFDKARTVARRALQTIDIKEEQERLNIWVALLNLENLYGTKESLQMCLEEALRQNDDYQVYCKMLEIYISSGKRKEVDETVNKMCRKFMDNMECWLLCAEALFKVKWDRKAQFLHERALSSLTKKEHVTLISRFALLENRYGFFEHAQTLFEHILTSYPGRIDVWNCYVDMLVKANSIETARKVLERACVNKLPVKKMKSLFMKRLTFEEKYGTESSVKAVKEQATDYVNRVTKKYLCSE